MTAKGVVGGIEVEQLSKKKKGLLEMDNSVVIAAGREV